MKTVRMALVAAGVAFALGCSGLSRQLTGYEVHFGEAARAPADFPMRLPPNAEPHHRLVSDEETVVSYYVDGPPEPLIEDYVRQMEARGLQVERPVRPGEFAAIGRGPHDHWYAELKPNAGRWMLRLDARRIP